jgi:hypothetical protein
MPATCRGVAHVVETQNQQIEETAAQDTAGAQVDMPMRTAAMASRF